MIQDRVRFSVAPLMEKPTENAVEIPADAMRWRIYAKRLPDSCGEIDGVAWVDEEASFELSWGWTANMTDEQIAKLADDCPTGKGTVITNLTMLKELRGELDALIEEAEKNPPVKDPRQVQAEKEMSEKMHALVEQLMKERENDPNSR